MTKILKGCILYFIIELISFQNIYAQLTLENIFIKHEYSPDALDDVAFYSKTEQYAMLEDYSKYQKIVTYNHNAQKLSEINLKKEFIKNDIDSSKRIGQFSISNTDKYFLLASDFDYHYRYSFSANYYVLNNQSITKIDDEKIEHPSFSNDDSKIAYIKDNDLFYFNLKSNTSTQITNDGEQNKIINGKSDWAYEEELMLTQAYIWNSDASKIAYLKFNESNVKEYNIPLYYGLTYPKIFTYKYPKVGEECSKVTLHYYDLKKKKNYAVAIPSGYEYLPRIYFSNDGAKIYYMLMNRWQNELSIYAYDIKSKQHKLVYAENNNTYVEIPTFILNDDNSFYITSEKEDYNQIYHYDANGKMIKKITNGNYNVMDILCVDNQNNRIYFSSNIFDYAETQVYAVDVKNLNIYKVTQEHGTHQVFFAPQMTYYIHQFSSDTIPTQTKILYNNNSSATVLIDNQRLKSKIDTLPKKIFSSIKINNEKFGSYMIVPNDFDSTKKYPMLMWVYGGPGIREVENKFGGSIEMWHKYLAQLGYIVVCVDNRGSSGQSASFKKSTYLQLGNYEVEDQTAAAKYYATLGFIDSNRIGMMGWSYGGYMSIMCLAKGNDVFKTAISIAPVTNWLWYNKIYTERYMKSVAENKNGYLNSNTLLHANKIKGNLLLIHGTADDNTQLQHTYELMAKLDAIDISYQNYIYIDKNHGISGGNTRYNLFKKVTNYILENL
jgi:dipeptidyl-peptidase-4